MKEIKTKLGSMYYEIKFDEVHLFDSDRDYINYAYLESFLNGEEDNCSMEKLEERIEEYYKDINTTDESIRELGEPVLWANSKEDLLEAYNDFYKEQSERYGEEFEPFTMEDFKDNIQVNRIGNIYFTIYFNEY